MFRPKNLVFLPKPPRLPTPTITRGPAPAESAPTFPATYPKIVDNSITELLNKLGAVERVE